MSTRDLRQLVHHLERATVYAHAAQLEGLAEQLEQYRETAAAAVVAQEGDTAPELDAPLRLRELLRMPRGTELVLTIDGHARRVRLHAATLDGADVVVVVDDLLGGSRWTIRKPNPDGNLTVTGPLLRVSGQGGGGVAASSEGGRGGSSGSVRAYVPQGPYRPAGAGGAGRC